MDETATDTPYLPRWALSELSIAMQIHRIVAVLGCRGSGKTTLLKQAHLPDSRFCTLEREATLRTACDDVTFFLTRNAARTLIIDEFQKGANTLVGNLKYIVDRNNEKGQFVICGASDYRRLPLANESLAGRVGVVRVRPLTHAEALGKTPGFLQAIFEGKLPSKPTYQDSGKMHVLRLAVAGGFPELLNETDVKVRSRWFEKQLIKRVLADAVELWKTRRIDRLKTFLAAVAADSGELVNKQNLMHAITAAWGTANAYLSMLEAMGLVDLVSGWY